LSWWCGRRGRPQFTTPLPVDRMSAGAFIWKSDPFEAVQELRDRPNVEYAGTDFLAAYWPLRRLGHIEEAR
ncbi:MAG: hypothetical protein ACYTDX_10800, partial [Planctomycetota bacterium]